MGRRLPPRSVCEPESSQGRHEGPASFFVAVQHCCANRTGTANREGSRASTNFGGNPINQELATNPGIWMLVVAA